MVARVKNLLVLDNASIWNIWNFLWTFILRLKCNDDSNWTYEGWLEEVPHQSDRTIELRERDFSALYHLRHPCRFDVLED